MPEWLNPQPPPSTRADRPKGHGTCVPPASDAHARQMLRTVQIMQEQPGMGAGLNLSGDALDGKTQTILQTRNRAALNAAGTSLPNGFGDACDLLALQRPLRAAYHDLVKRMTTDWDMAAYMAGKKPTQDVTVLGFQFQQQKGLTYPMNEPDVRRGV